MPASPSPEAKRAADRAQLDSEWKDAQARLADVQKDACKPDIPYSETVKLYDHAESIQKTIAGLRRRYGKLGLEAPK